MSKYSSCEPDEPCQLGILFDLQPGWHIYWKNPGDSGAAPKFEFISPPNLHKIDFKWPVPKKIPVQHLVNFGYEGKIILPFEITAPNNLSNLDILVKGEWLVCKEDCIPFEDELSYSQPINNQKARLPATDLFDQLKFPIKNSSLPPSKQLAVSYDDSVLELLLPGRLSEKNISFFPAAKHISESSAQPSILFEDNHTRIQIPTKKITNGDLSLENLIQIDSETISFTIANDVESFNFDSTQNNSAQFSLFKLFLLAFLGGLILNLMPCVLPVLAIKAVQLVSLYDSSLRARLLDCISYTAGVFSAIFGLFAIVVLAKQSGEFLGWGFQFQNPLFAASCSALFIVLGFNLLGIFELPNLFPQKLLKIEGSTKIAKGFFSGIGTTIISTPCTAPFAGASIAYALTASVAHGAFIFAGLSLGLAAPFALAYLIPHKIKSLVPKPGSWMLTFRKVCSLPMFITAIWLGWVAYSQISNSGLNHNQVFVDKWQQEWLPYSPELINQIKSEKQVAYIDFTASWCITCQVNKSVVFSNKEVRDYIALNKIKLVRADWTNKDTNIGLALKGFNRASVPLNIIYRKNSDYITLPTILTASTVLEALTLANKQNP